METGQTPSAQGNFKGVLGWLFLTTSPKNPGQVTLNTQVQMAWAAAGDGKILELFQINNS